ncbi:MAG: hypothetical protein ABIG44_11060 [Planctomycetota bacterium]
MKQSRWAVTLLELLLVISLLGLLAVFLWPDFGTATRHELLDESARRMKTLIAMCRAEAMNQSIRYQISFRADGSLKVRRQYDPIEAPHIFVPVRSDWARRAILLEDVWVESVVPLPDGPAPILIEDELIEVEEMEEDPIPIEEFEEPVVILFETDGTSDSLRWTLRDANGRGVEMMLDGRLGRVTIDLVVREDDAERPPEIEEDEIEPWDDPDWEPER